MQYIKLSLLFATTLSSSAWAHLVLASPPPFDKTEKPPLLTSGENYPCQGLTSGTETTYKVGDNVTLSFTGQKPATATHQGGTCQLSLTSDTSPSKKSKFKAIATIEGGCPAYYPSGNTPMDDPFEFIFQIPPKVPNGKYTFAWTWFGKMAASPEMYMNCAAINVEGSDAEGDFDSLDYPDMFVANVGSAGNNCKATIGKSLQVPNPGNNVLINDDPKDAAPPKGCSGSKRDLGMRAMPSATGKPDVQLRVAIVDNALPAYSAATQLGDSGDVYVSAPTGSTGSSSGGGSGGGESSAENGASSPNPTGVSGATASPVASVAASGSAGSGATASPVASVAASGSAGSGATASPVASAAASGGSGCQEGTWNCIDGKSYARCAGGSWSSTQSLADGTKCTVGISQNIQMAAK